MDPQHRVVHHALLLPQCPFISPLFEVNFDRPQQDGDVHVDVGGLDPNQVQYHQSPLQAQEQQPQQHEPHAQLQEHDALQPQEQHQVRLCLSVRSTVSAARVCTRVDCVRRGTHAREAGRHCTGQEALPCLTVVATVGATMGCPLSHYLESVVEYAGCIEKYVKYLLCLSRRS